MESSLNHRQKQIISNLSATTWIGITEIMQKLAHENEAIALTTIKRDLGHLIDIHYIERQGQAKATVYRLSPLYSLLKEVDPQEYFSSETRQIREHFNFDIFSLIAYNNIFNFDELAVLNRLNKEFQSNRAQLSETIQKKELERATIELSWKSSAMEGNTYSLLETETLLKEGIEAIGKKKEEAIMLMNHKKALDFVGQNIPLFKNLNINTIEQLHSILIDGLGIEKNVRKTLVGITGTNYKPLDNEFQIREALEKLCDLINNKSNFFEKSFLSMILLSYIQPFADGNKRTGRITANAILLANNSFPLPLRSLNINEYKQALLIFYEINNTYLFKKLYMQQCQYSVDNYFKPHAQTASTFDSVEK